MKSRGRAYAQIYDVSCKSEVTKRIDDFIAKHKIGSRSAFFMRCALAHIDQVETKTATKSK